MRDEMTPVLTDQERRFLALAIQGLTLRHGPPVFALAASIAEKLRLGDLLEEYLKSWLADSPAM